MAAAPSPEIEGTNPQNQDSGAAPGGAAPAPSQAPANPTQIKLAQMYQLCKMLAQQDPTLSAGLAKAAQGIQEAQTALVSQPAQPSAGQNPAF